MKPRLLDLFCGAGGATKGLQRAGFYVVGVDIKPQPHYCGDEFVLGDAFEVMDILLSGGYVTTNLGNRYYLSGFDAYWASPECQRWSTGTRIHGYEHPDQITPIRERLRAITKPWVIENIETAPLIDPLLLCGTMFGLKVKRHRLFESNIPLYFPPATCSCSGKAGFTAASDGQSSYKRGAKLISVAGHNFLIAEAREAMGIPWMTQHEISQAIPPAYSEYIGKQFIREQSQCQSLPSRCSV